MTARSLAASFLAIGFALALAGCPKAPLQENRAEFEVASAHWFANEKTEYVFFSVKGLRPAQAKLSWPLSFEIGAGDGQIAGLKAAPDGFASLDFTQAVHRHRLVECGEGRVCGSFSFHSEFPLKQLRVRFRYNSGGSMNEVASIPVAIHPDGQGADSQSALVYGVYDKDNTRVQVRVHDNFGTPDNEAVRSFGMERSFKIAGLKAAPLSAADEAVMRATSGSALLFPATACVGRALGTSDWQFAGHESWSRVAFDPAEPESDACFKVDSLDHQGKVLTSAAGVARKNPVFNDQPLTVRPPLKQTIQIPVVLSYCLDSPGAGDLTSADFLRYQYFIMGMNPKAPIDACFTTGEEDKFARDLERVLDQKLAAFRASSSGDQDFFFNLVINHRLALSVRKFHQIVAEKLRLKIASEVLRISPRLVGAFVYDSRPAPDVDAGANVTWCPKPERAGGGGLDDPDANCTPRGAGDVTLGPFNFLIPMGPYPTLDTYVDYFHKYGDRGETTDPQFTVSSVQTNANSVTDQLDGRFFTFFDGERLSLNPNERLKFCRDRDGETLIDQLAFRKVEPSGKVTVLDSTAAQDLLLNGAGGTSLLAGLWWDSPYIGTFSFNSPLRGKIFSVIPISATLAKKQKLGDPRWSRPVWNLTPMLQKCVRHCTHPFFDEAGVYQAALGWHEVPQCPAPRTPEYVP